MKTVFSFAFVCLLAITSAIANPSLPKDKVKRSSNESLSKEIRDFLGEPNLQRMGIEDVTVKVQFVINSNREVRVIEIHTENEALKQYIETRLDNQKVKTQDIEIQENYFIPLKFQEGAES
ncbi:MAG TPA: hypothetical protein P5275_00100 [Saprospiraceae bacterium]|nr:hypothetical protein [Saprospiraceae bacterium]MCB9268674.1 hypothetical protein [Lewinellaceae bacterium]HPG05738.1 hypothetical protein [Saprospiraceae bacterium]HPR00454.1 hypothetical protein [Saprospiraceae bacterium]HQU54731.1 hypothetical protein [Saprospiraceae bacterium]